MVVLSHSSLVAAVLTVLTPGVWWKRCTEHIQGLFALGCHSVQCWAWVHSWVQNQHAAEHCVVAAQAPLNQYCLSFQGL